MKKLVLVTLIGIITFIVGWNINKSNATRSISDLTGANIEALSHGELASGYADKECEYHMVNNDYVKSCTCTGDGTILFCI